LAYNELGQPGSEKAIISPAAGLRAKSIISPAMFTYENPYLA